MVKCNNNKINLCFASKLYVMFSRKHKNTQFMLCCFFSLLVLYVWWCKCCNVKYVWNRREIFLSYVEERIIKWLLYTEKQRMNQPTVTLIGYRVQSSISVKLYKYIHVSWFHCIILNLSPLYSTDNKLTQIISNWI